MCDSVIQYSNKLESKHFCFFEALSNEHILHLQYNKESLKLNTK